MVLEEATAPAAPQTLGDDSSPASDFDPYASTSSSSGSSELAADNGLSELSPSGYKIPMDQVLGPAPIFGPLAGFTKRNEVLMIAHNIKTHAQAAQRQLNAQECDAIAWHGGKAYSITSYGSPLGVGAATARWWTTRAKMRFPFYQPDLAKYKFQSFGPLRDFTAFKAWQSLRFFSYGVLGHFIGKLFLATYGVTVMATGMALDNRLKVMFEDIKKNNKGSLSAAYGRRSTDQRQAPLSQVRDASPLDASYGVDPQEEDQTLPRASDMANSTEQQTRSAGWPQQPGYNEAGSGSRDSPEQLSSGPAFVDFDDASPTARSSPNDAGSASPSAWERLRRGGPPRNQTPRNPPPTGRSTTGGDAWAKVRGSPSAEQEEQGSNTISDEQPDDDKKWR